MLYISNAFALSMLDREAQRGTPGGYVPRSGDVPLERARVPRPVEDPAAIIADHEAHGQAVVSIIGHQDTAAVFSAILGRDLIANRATVRLGPDDRLLVGQYIGPRLPEGATTLPVGASIEWWLV